MLQNPCPVSMRYKRNILVKNKLHKFAMQHLIEKKRGICCMVFLLFVLLSAIIINFIL